MRIDVPYTTALDLLPLPAAFLAIVVLVLLSIEGGFRLGLYRRKRSEKEKDAPVGAMVGSTLGLLAFMLAFTFGMAASRFDARKTLVLDEANAIGTTYLRAAMLPEGGNEVRDLLRQYVDQRVAAVNQATPSLRSRSRKPCRGSCGPWRWPPANSIPTRSSSACSLNP